MVIDSDKTSVEILEDVRDRWGQVLLGRREQASLLFDLIVEAERKILDLGNDIEILKDTPPKNPT